MLVKDAKNIVRQWVMEEATKLPGYRGAYFIGSINWREDDVDLPTTSDVDIQIVIEGNPPKDGYRMLPYGGLLIQISYARGEEFASPESILGDYPLAGHFTKPNIIADPTGILTRVHEVVSRDFSKRQWVRKRCEHARNVILETIGALREQAPLHDQVSVWLPAACVPSHIIMVADLRDPTVRRMLVIQREVLAKYGHLSLHDSVLELLGSARMSHEEVEELFRSCTEVFEVTKGFVKTPFFGSALISDEARRIAIGGGQALLDEGNHREAMWWIALIHTWCQTALVNDAPVAVLDKYTPRYHRLLGTLGITSFADLEDRAQQIRATLPAVWTVTEAILEANPAIED